jgi:hypothetical protein
LNQVLEKEKMPKINPERRSEESPSADPDGDDEP